MSTKLINCVNKNYNLEICYNRTRSRKIYLLEEASVRDVSGRGSVHPGNVRRGSVRRGSVWLGSICWGCVRRESVRTP